MAVSRVGGGELSLACSSVTAKSQRSCYIVLVPTDLRRYCGAGYSHETGRLETNLRPSAAEQTSCPDWCPGKRALECTRLANAAQSGQ